MLVLQDYPAACELNARPPLRASRVLDARYDCGQPDSCLPDPRLGQDLLLRPHLHRGFQRRTTGHWSASLWSYRAGADLGCPVVLQDPGRGDDAGPDEDQVEQTQRHG